jgi:hypothetical protein
VDRYYPCSYIYMHPPWSVCVRTVPDLNLLGIEEGRKVRRLVVHVSAADAQVHVRGRGGGDHAHGTCSGVVCVIAFYFKILILDRSTDRSIDLLSVQLRYACMQGGHGFDPIDRRHSERCECVHAPAVTVRARARVQRRVASYVFRSMHCVDGATHGRYMQHK